MKKHTLLVLLLITFTALWAQNKSTAPTAIPKAFLGHWQKGVFSLTSFEEPNGKYVGPANEMSVSYVIEASGKGKEYFISNSTTYNCRTQILGYREGQVIINASDNSFEFRPSSGYYTMLTCMSKSSTKKPYTGKDLYPAYSTRYYLSADDSGTPVLMAENSDGTKGLQLKKLQ
jgi:hypothetical protein